MLWLILEKTISSCSSMQWQTWKVSACYKYDIIYGNFQLSTDRQRKETFAWSTDEKICCWLTNKRTEYSFLFVHFGKSGERNEGMESQILELSFICFSHATAGVALPLACYQSCLWESRPVCQRRLKKQIRGDPYLPPRINHLRLAALDLLFYVCSLLSVYLGCPRSF